MQEVNREGDINKEIFKLGEGTKYIFIQKCSIYRV